MNLMEVSIPLLVFLGGSLAFGVGIVLPFVVGRFSARNLVASTDREFATPPSIGVVIPAYLESSVVGATVDALRRQLHDWPGGFAVTVVASDEETARAAEAHGARVVRCQPKGKPAAINLGVREATEDVIVLSDANCRLFPDDWPHLLCDVLRTADLVSGAKTESGGGETIYWWYESAVKTSRASQETLSVVGEFMAFRREQFVPVPERTLTDDLTMAIDFALRGLVVRTCPDIVTSEPPIHGREQLERRIRISAGHWAEAIPRWRRLLTVRAGLQFLAHKGYRMSIGALGFWLAVGAAVFLSPPWSVVAVAFTLIAAWLIYLRGYRVPAVIRLASTVIVLQVVTVLGLVRAVRRKVTSGSPPGWQKVAR